MVKRKKADIDIFLNELSTKILNNEHGLIKETIDEKTGICTKVEVSGVLEVYPDKIEYKGVAVTAKEDMDIDSFKEAGQGVEQWVVEELKNQGYDDGQELVDAFK